MKRKEVYFQGMTDILDGKSECEYPKDTWQATEWNNGMFDGLCLKQELVSIKQAESWADKVDVSLDNIPQDCIVCGEVRICVKTDYLISQLYKKINILTMS